MAQPVLVRSYTSPKPTPSGSPSGRSHVLPPIAAFAFEDILRAADCAEFQSAIDGIAEICAKNRMSLAEEYGSHLPPVGEITAVSADTPPVRQQHGRLNMRRALTSVPEASYGSSDSSPKRKKKGFLGFGSGQEVAKDLERKIQISSTGRTIPICGTTAMSLGGLEIAADLGEMPGHERLSPALPSLPSQSSLAASSLRVLLENHRIGLG